ncbi:unnamed protein product [Discosporangium mesarthrocarpum]
MYSVLCLVTKQLSCHNCTIFAQRQVKNEKRKRLCPVQTGYYTRLDVWRVFWEQGLQPHARKWVYQFRVKPLPVYAQSQYNLSLVVQARRAVKWGDIYAQNIGSSAAGHYLSACCGRHCFWCGHDGNFCEVQHVDRQYFSSMPPKTQV